MREIVTTVIKVTATHREICVDSWVEEDVVEREHVHATV